jgi:hypothetical protein
VSLSRKGVVITASVGVVLLGAVGLYLFQPWRLFTTRTVDDSLVVAAPTATATAPPSASPSNAPVTSAPPAEPVIVGAGAFRSLDHETTGQAQLVRLADGRHVVQFVNLDTSDGPDLRVYLSEKPATAAEPEFGSGFVELGFLKGNQGNQVYQIESTVDVGRYRSVVIWCERFSSGFGVAPLTA